MSISHHDKIFDPFCSSRLSENINDSFTYDTFENIRESCTFHVPKDVSKVISNNSQKLNVLHLNARSIVNKMDDLCSLISETAIMWHAIAVSESWISQSIQSNFNIPGYQAFHCCRPAGTGGGSAIYAASQLSPCQLHNPPFTTAEVVCVQIKSKNQRIVICQIYRPPSSDKHQFITELEQCLIWLHKMNTTALITGDFNFDLFSLHTNSSVHSFLTSTLSYGFLPTISRMTRCVHPSSTLIDNILCNDLSRAAHSGIILSDLSDHLPIFLSLNIQITSNINDTKPTSQRMFNYKKINELRQFLTENIVNVERETCPETLAHKITELYNEGIDKYSYNKRLTRKNHPRMPWMTPAIMSSVDHKNELFRKKLHQPSVANITKYNKYRNLLTTIIRRAKKNYYDNEFAKNAGNSKETWKTLQSLIKSKQSRDDGPKNIKDRNDHLVSADSDIAESFNEFFTEIGNKLKNSIPSTSFDPLKLINNIDDEMLLEPATTEELTNIIENLNNVGSGIDSISAKIFKLTYKPIIKQLLYLYNKCLELGTFPAAFKIAVVRPIFKGGDKENMSNYRPISLLPIMSKILEKLIHRRLVEHMSNNNIIHPNQFGFQKNKSTYMPILILQDTVTKAFEEGDHILGLYLDLKKAFDTVDVELLLKKLHKYGIRNTCYKMLRSYLTDRIQCVKIRNTLSTFKQVTIGVPQGSILGPLLFILYINDLPNISKDITCLSYADDTAIIFKNKDPKKLQNIVDTVTHKMYDWFNANFLSINVSKTFTQHYSIGSPAALIDVKINGEKVKESEVIKYLGLLIDSKLKFTKHIDHISSILSRNIGIIARIRYFIDKKTTHLLYNSLILPHINYCCLIWGSNYHSQLNKVIILQKRAVRLIEQIYPPLSSKPIFKKYKILRITDIAISQMLLVLHKFITRQLPTVFDSIYERYNAVSPHRRQNRHFKQPFSNRNYRLYTTSCLGPKVWNDIIPNKFPTMQDIPSSKNIIKKVIREHFINTY